MGVQVQGVFGPEGLRRQRDLSAKSPIRGDELWAPVLFRARYTVALVARS